MATPKAAVPTGEFKPGKILAQIEFYFSNRNLWNDQTLRDQIAQSKDRWVSLEFVAELPKVLRVCTDLELIRSAISISTKLELSLCGATVRRTTSLPPSNPFRDAKRCIYADTLPAGSTIGSIRTLFNRFGNVLSVIPCEVISDNGCPPECAASAADKLDEGAQVSSVLVEFGKKLESKRAVQLMSHHNNRYLDNPARSGFISTNNTPRTHALLSAGGFEASPLSLSSAPPSWAAKGELTEFTLEPMTEENAQAGSPRVTSWKDSKLSAASPEFKPMPATAGSSSTSSSSTITTSPTKSTTAAAVTAALEKFSVRRDRLSSRDSECLSSPDASPMASPLFGTFDPATEEKLDEVFNGVFVISKYSYLTRMERVYNQSQNILASPLLISASPNLSGKASSRKTGSPKKTAGKTPKNTPKTGAKNTPKHTPKNPNVLNTPKTGPKAKEKEGKESKKKEGRNSARKGSEREVSMRSPSSSPQPNVTPQPRSGSINWRSPSLSSTRGSAPQMSPLLHANTPPFHATKAGGSAVATQLNLTPSPRLGPANSGKKGKKGKEAKEAKEASPRKGRGSMSEASKGAPKGGTVAGTNGQPVRSAMGLMKVLHQMNSDPSAASPGDGKDPEQKRATRPRVSLTNGRPSLTKRGSASISSRFAAGPSDTGVGFGGGRGRGLPKNKPKPSLPAAGGGAPLS